MNALSRLLDQPEYFHTTINHFPLVGLLVAMVMVAAALVVRSRPAIFIGLVLLAVTALSVWPVFRSGEQGYDRVLSMSDDAGQAFLKHHEELAERWVLLYYAAAAVAALTCGVSWKWPKLLVTGSILSLILATASLVAGFYIARAGGEVRHREFRSGPPPAATRN
jgi:hypothetical protein